MTSQEAAALLDVLISKAPGLRGAGVLALELGEVKVQLMPPDVNAPEGMKAIVQSGNPLYDSALYGRGPGESLPGYALDDDDGQDR